MITTIRYHVELTDDPGGEQSDSLAQAMNGRVVSTVRRFDGINDLALIDIDADMRDSFEALLDVEASDNNSVIAWRTSLPNEGATT